MGTITFHLSERHMWLREEADCRFLPLDEFLALATSRRRLIRADLDEAGLQGIQDPETGLTYYLDHEPLDSRCRC